MGWYLAPEGLMQRALTTNYSPEVEETLKRHICQTHCKAHSPSGCMDICHHSPPPHHPPPTNTLPVQGWQKRMRGGDMKVWPEAERNMLIFFQTVSRAHCVHLGVGILFAHNTLLCVYKCKECCSKGGKNSLSLDESACCLLKLLEQQQSYTLWVPVCLISCCHFSSCSLVNHLSRSPLCNQLNLVIKWKKSWKMLLSADLSR